MSDTTRQNSLRVLEENGPGVWNFALEKRADILVHWRVLTQLWTNIGRAGKERRENLAMALTSLIGTESVISGDPFMSEVAKISDFRDAKESPGLPTDHRAPRRRAKISPGGEVWSLVSARMWKTNPSHVFAVGGGDAHRSLDSAMLAWAPCGARAVRRNRARRRAANGREGSRLSWGCEVRGDVKQLQGVTSSPPLRHAPATRL